MTSIKKINILKKNRIIKGTVGYCCSKKFYKEARSFSANNKWCTNTIKTLACHNSETKCHLKMKVRTDAYLSENKLEPR